MEPGRQFTGNKKPVTLVTVHYDPDNPDTPKVNETRFVSSPEATKHVVSMVEGTGSFIWPNHPALDEYNEHPKYWNSVWHSDNKYGVILHDHAGQSHLIDWDLEEPKG